MKKIEKVLIIGKVWPEPRSSAAGSRMMHIIRLFQSRGWQVTFVSAASESEYAEDLDALDITTKRIEINNASFDEFVSELDPDIVLFDRFMTEEQFGWRVKEQCPYAMRIIDTEDLHGLREARRISLNKGREYIPAELHNDVARREIAAIYRSDLSLITSRSEMFTLKKHIGINLDLVYQLPLLTDKKEFTSSKEFTERQDFVTIGNFLHKPNWDTVQYLKNSIWPHIRRELPGTSIHIYGAYSSHKVEQLHNEKEGFLIKGRAEDALEVIGNARVLLAPLRFGAGQKGKILDAMITGTPNVTTTIGAESMHSGRDWPGLIEDKSLPFAKASVKLYQNEDFWKDCQSRINRILSELFYVENLGDKFLKKIEDIYEKLLHHRNKNFTGSMLWHQSLNSAKFMGKWIEEKNRS